MWGWLRSLFSKEAAPGLGPSSAIVRPKHAPPWLDQIPASVVFIDVETTGLYSNDRIVSLGAIKLMTEPLLGGDFKLSLMHLIFNPEKKSHPRAEAVHGYSHSLLRSQDRFEAYAGQVRDFIHSGDLVVAHNADFDAGFIDREFGRLGLAPIERPIFCTMEGYRQRDLPGRASLDAVCSQIGMSRMGQRHGALEDAWLAMNVYLWMHGCPQRAEFPRDRDHKPTNLKPTLAVEDAPYISSSTGQSRSEGDLTPEASRITDLVEAVKQAKRVGDLAHAEKLLIEEIGRQEEDSRRNGYGVAPWYYEQLAIVYAKQKRYTDELQVLERYDRQTKSPGVGPAKLKERLGKARERVGRRESKRPSSPSI